MIRGVSAMRHSRFSVPRRNSKRGRQLSPGSRLTIPGWVMPGRREGVPIRAGRSENRGNCIRRGGAGANEVVQRYHMKCTLLRLQHFSYRISVADTLFYLTEPVRVMSHSTFPVMSRLPKSRMEASAGMKPSASLMKR